MNEAADSGLPTPDSPELDIGFMKRAIELAREAELAGEVPVGAVVVKDGARLVVPDMEKLLDMVTRFRTDVVVNKSEMGWFLC